MGVAMTAVVTVTPTKLTRTVRSRGFVARQSSVFMITWVRGNLHLIQVTARITKC